MRLVINYVRNVICGALALVSVLAFSTNNVGDAVYFGVLAGLIRPRGRN